MTEKNKNKMSIPNLYIDYNNMTDFLNDYVLCLKLDLYYRGKLYTEEAMLPNARKNKRKLIILKECLDKTLINKDSKFGDSVCSFISLKLKVFIILDKIPAAFKLLNLAKNEDNEEKKNFLVQLDAKEQIVIANTKEGSKQMEKEKVEVNIKTDHGIIYSDSNGTESYQKKNIKDKKEVKKRNRSNTYNGENQSTKQGSSKIMLDVNVNDGIKLIDDKYINNSLPNTMEENRTITMKNISPKLKNSISSEKLQKGKKEFLKSHNLKLNNFANNHKGDNMISEIVEREKRDVILESVKSSNKTTNKSPEESNSKKSEVFNQYKQKRLRLLNSKIIGYELKQSFLEKLFKSIKKLESTFSFSEYYSLSEEAEDKIKKTMEKHKIYINNIMNDLLYHKDAVCIIRDTMRSIFLVETTTVSPYVFTGDIQKVQKVSSNAVSKTCDKSTSDDTFQLDSKTGKKIKEADELGKQSNKNISFKINTDGKKIFMVVGQDFKASESKQVIFNCKDEKFKISFIDNQIFFSTENSEFHLSIRNPKPVDIQDGCTQIDSRQ